MKKLEKLFDKRSLSSEVGKVGAYNHQRMVISANEENGTWVFTIKRYERSGYTSTQTIVLENVLNEMKAFNPKATAWKVSRKPKAIKAPKVKAETAAPVPVAKVKGRN